MSEREVSLARQAIRLARVFKDGERGWEYSEDELMESFAELSARPTRDEIARVLGEHTPLVDTYGPPRVAACSCGWDEPGVLFRYHLADTIARLLEGLDANPSASGPGIQAHKIDGGA